MKRLSLVVIAVLCAISFSVYNYAQPKSAVRKHILRVESNVENKHKIPFTFVYSQGDFNSITQLVTLDKETPFEMEITADNFTSLIQDKKLNGELKVFITTFENGKKKGSAECNFLLNVIRINKDQVGVYSY